MSLDDWYLVFVSVCLVLVLVACAPVAVALLPSREESFFALAVLGEEGMAELYYPGDDPQIEVGEEVHWTIYVNNQMGEVQYVAVRVKLLNSIELAPNSTSFSPSPSPVIYEVRRVLLDNETLLYPFSWSIENVEPVDDFLEITQLSMNGGSVGTRVIAEGGSNYRFIIELWVYDDDFKDLRFGWRYGDGLRCAWNQVWFNAALTVS